MKKIIVLTMALICGMTTVSMAQNRGLKADINNTHIKPQTTVIVEVKVKKESVMVGPYARYAQQMLGVVPPLNNKVVYSIEGVRISTTHTGEIVRDGRNISKHNINSGFMTGNQLYGTESIDFKDMGIDPVFVGEGGTDKSVKTMATDAANAIFKLRRRRFDLVTGELGEQVYGEGMKAALAEIKRMEREYTALFLGKQKVEYTTYQYEVIPTASKNHYIVCRFNEQEGMVDENNITGTPVVLSVTKENMIVSEDNSKLLKKSEEPVDKYIIPDMAQCRVMFGEKLLVSKKVNVFQFGEIGVNLIPIDNNIKKK